MKRTLTAVFKACFTRDMTGNRAARLFPIDALRGLIMVVMALDHANHFVAQKHSSGEYWGGYFPTYESALPFLTRLVTHLAAPGFFFLMGVGMILFARSRWAKGWSRWAVLRHFWLRGLLLIVLQFTLVNLAWSLSPGGWIPSVYVGVLFALGGAMILASLLVGLTARWLLAITTVLLLLSAMIVPDAGAWGVVPAGIAEKLLLWPGGDAQAWSNFPILPWLPLVTMGLTYGRVLLAEPRRIWRWSLWASLAFLAAFLIVRLIGGPGNIRPPQAEGWIAFLNVVKYPPSPVFILLTMGVNFFLLWLFSRAGAEMQRVLNPLLVFGRVPLFFYLVHLFLYAALGHLLTPEGSTIARMLPIWIAGLVILYPLCLWFGRFKQSRPSNSLWRFL